MGCCSPPIWSWENATHGEVPVTPAPKKAGPKKAGPKKDFEELLDSLGPGTFEVDISGLPEEIQPGDLSDLTIGQLEWLEEHQDLLSEAQRSSFARAQSHLMEPMREAAVAAFPGNVGVAGVSHYWRALAAQLALSKIVLPTSALAAVTARHQTFQSALAPALLALSDHFASSRALSESFAKSRTAAMVALAGMDLESVAKFEGLLDGPYLSSFGEHLYPQLGESSPGIAAVLSAAKLIVDRQIDSAAVDEIDEALPEELRASIEDATETLAKRDVLRISRADTRRAVVVAVLLGLVAVGITAGLNWPVVAVVLAALDQLGLGPRKASEIAGKGFDRVVGDDSGKEPPADDE